MQPGPSRLFYAATSLDISFLQYLMKHPALCALTITLHQAVPARWMPLLHNLCHLMDKTSALPEFLARYSSLLLELPARSRCTLHCTALQHTS